MTTDVGSHGQGILLSMLHMPGLMAATAADNSLMYSAAAAGPDLYGHHPAAATSSGTADSHLDALQADAAAAQLLEQQVGLSLATQEAALNQLKKACKAAKGGCFGAKLHVQMGILATASHTPQQLSKRILRASLGTDQQTCLCQVML